MNKRQFIRLVTVGATVAALPVTSWAMEMLDEEDPVALASVDVERFPKRKGADGAKQLC